MSHQGRGEAEGPRLRAGKVLLLRKSSLECGGGEAKGLAQGGEEEGQVRDASWVLRADRRDGLDHHSHDCTVLDVRISSY